MIEAASDDAASIRVIQGVFPNGDLFEFDVYNASVL